MRLTLPSGKQMKLTTRLIMLTLCASFALSSHALLLQAPNNERDFMRNVFASLQLTDSQKQQLRALPRVRRDARGSNNFADLMTMALTDDFDNQQFEQELSKRLVEQKTKGLAMAERRHAMHQILTAEQITQFEQMAEQRNNNGRQGRAPGEWLSGLDLDAEQQNVIELSTKDLQAITKEMESLRRTFRESEKALIAADTFDTQSWLNEFDQHAEQMKIVSNDLILTMNLIYMALTETQQAQLKGMLKGRTQKMRRRH